MQRTHLTTRIRNGDLVVGCAHVIRDEALTEGLRSVEVDFLLVDMQHVAIGLESLQRLLVALQPSDVAVLVRVPTNDPIVIGQVLDVGATGIIVPMVNTAGHAICAVTAAMYPPAGTRSWGPRRVASFHGDPLDYARFANDNTAVIVQIETAEAVGNVDEILTSEGVTGVMIGPADLAISMGHMFDRDNPEVQSAIQHVFKRCQVHGVAGGIFTNDTERAQHWISMGATIVNCSSDATFVAEGFRRVAATLKTPARVG